MSTENEECEETLARGLNSWSSRRRRAAMEALSNSSTPTAIELLRKVASGANKGRFRRYNLRQQLDAIEYLGRSASGEALAFLERIYASTIAVEHEEHTLTYGGHSDTATETESYEVYTYPNASNALQKVLGFRVQIYGGGSKYITEDERQRHLNGHPHATLSIAIEGLRSKLEGEPIVVGRGAAEVKAIRIPPKSRRTIRRLHRTAKAAGGDAGKLEVEEEQ